MRRAVGPGHGYLISGLVGGMVSSTNVTFTFARLSRNEHSMERALAFGAVGANAVLYPRVLAAITVLNPALVLPLVPYLATPAAVAAMVAAAGSRKSNLQGGGNPSLSTRNPLQLSAALQMAALFQIVIMIVSLARETWGQAGVLTTAAVVGLTDVDALTVSMARGVAQTISHDTAALAIAIGVLANTALKMAVALFFGAATFRAIVAGTLMLMIVAATVSMVAVM